MDAGLQVGVAYRLELLGKTKSSADVCCSQKQGQLRIFAARNRLLAGDIAINYRTFGRLWQLRNVFQAFIEMETIAASTKTMNVDFTI